MINASDQFKARVLKLEIGEEYVYFRGHLASARAHMPLLEDVGAMAYGLVLLEASVLTQKRIGDLEGSEYRLRVLRPIRNVDFDKGRAAYYKSLRSKEAA